MRSASFGLAVGALLGESTRKTHIRNLDLSSLRIEDVVRLYVAMEHLVFMHLMEAKRDLVQAITAEILRVVPETLGANIGHAALVHVVEKNVAIFPTMVQVDAIYQFVAVEVCI